MDKRDQHIVQKYTTENVTLEDIGFDLGRGRLVLARKDKAGSYSVDNCELVTLEVNSRNTDGWSVGRQARLLKRIAIAELLTVQVANLRKIGKTISEVAEEVSRSTACISVHVAKAKRLGLLP